MSDILYSSLVLSSKAGSGGGSVDETKIIIKTDTLPTASAENAGKIYIYSGATNSTYTHGYIYESQPVNPTYEANLVFDHGTFGSLDFYKAAQFLIDATSDFKKVKSGTMTYDLAGNIWHITFKDKDGNAIRSNYNLYTEDLEEYDIMPVDTFTDGQVVNFTVASLTEHADSYAMVRIDVQPAGPTIPTPATYWYTGNTGTTITIVDTTDANCVEVFRNGILQRQGVAYTVSGTTLTLTDAVDATDEIAVKVNDLSSADLQAIEALLHNVNSGTN